MDSMFSNMITKYKNTPIQVRASFWFLACSFLQRGISVLSTPIFSRLLSTSEYGRYNVFNSWLGIVTIIVSLNLYAGVYTQGLIKFDKERQIFSSSLQGLTLVLVSGWTLVYLVFHNFWNRILSLTTVQMLSMLLLIWTSAIFGFWATEQRVKLNYIKLVVVTLVMAISKPVIGVYFVLHADDKVTARILGLVVVELVCCFGLFVSQIRNGKKIYAGKFWKYAVLYNLPLIPHYLSQTVLNSADRIMIERISGEDAAGIYSLAYSISLLMTLFNTALSQTMGPWIYQKIKDKKSQDISNVAYATLILVAVVNILLIAFAPEAVTIFAPDEYKDAIWVIPPVAVSVYFMFAYDLFAKFQFYYEKTKFVMYASVIAAVLNVILNSIFIRSFGYVAASYTTLFCYIASTVGHYLFMRKICNEYMHGEQVYNLKVLLSITVSFMFLGFMFMVLYRYNYLRYIFIILFGFVLVLFRKKTTETICVIIKGRRNR